MGGEAEQRTPLAAGKPGKTASGTVKDLRHHISGNEVHFHDDKETLKFVWPDKHSFRRYWREFVGLKSRMEDGDRAALIGDVSRVKGQKAAVLVLERKQLGDFSIYLEEYDAGTVYTFPVERNDTVDQIDEWVAGNC